ncbi:MAG: hypothetical protein IIY89_08925, partial [Clostridia bacterium]|nr:hypothetical protein [Clostridia bacterium]
MRLKKIFSVLLVAAMFLSMGTGLLPVLSETGMVAFAVEIGEFKIEDGVLIRYNGSGGDVVIPDYVT